MVQQAYPPVSVRQLCGWLGVSRSWYYACPPVDEQAAQDMALREAIEQIVLEFPGYGYRRVTQALRRTGWPVNHKRVLRVMREESLLCQLQRHFVVTTDSAHGYQTYPTLLAEMVLTRADQAWVADITSIRLPTTFVYLACVLDAFSRHWRWRWRLADLPQAGFTIRTGACSTPAGSTLLGWNRRKHG